MKYLLLFDCFGIYWREKTLSSGELILFTTISLFLISVLLYYYGKISIKDKSRQLEISIYNSKDIFSQEIIGNSNFSLAEKSTSVFTKIIVYVLATLILTSSMSNLLTNGVVDYLF